MSDIISDIRNLAIPFSLMLAANAMKHMQKNKSKKTQSGGDCSCRGSTTSKLGGSRKELHNEVDKLSKNLNAIMTREY